MRDVPAIAREFLLTRMRYLTRKSLDASKETNRLNAVEVAKQEGRMEALAWVLDVDLQLMSAPKVAEIVAPLRVEIEPVMVVGRRYWLLQVPAEREPHWRTEFWSAFLSERQMRELRRSVMGHLRGLSQLAMRRALSADSADMVADTVSDLPDGA